jgi:L-ascorbate metabolism protein UlaG (beta-lactamase superfamily)
MIDSILDKMIWLGHAGFQIQVGPRTLYIDPFQIERTQPADILCITHAHYDHCSPDDIRKIQHPDTIIVTEKESARQIQGDVRILRPGDRIDLGDISIEAVPAYNTNKQFHPKENEWLGFIVVVDGVRIYHAGDTDLIPEMDEIDADIALLPVSGTYVMDPEEAVAAAQRIQPGIAIPMHYDAIVGSVTDAERFRNSLEGKCRVIVKSPSP